MFSGHLTDEFINELIAMEKRITFASHVNWQRRLKSRRKSFKLTSTDGRFPFQIFLRQLERQPTDFSAGLVYCPAGQPNVVLLRCNGDHGLHGNLDGGELSGYHIHRASEAAMRAGRKAEYNAVPTDEYVTFEGAVHKLVHEVNVVNWRDHLKDIEQIPLLSPGQDELT